MNNKLEVIGIDHGWSMMKTVTQVFVTGVKEITTTPALFGDVLEYDGKYYKDYKLYDEQNRVVTTKKGDELYTHYDKVESSVRERYEKVQKEQKKTTKKKTVTTRKER